MGECEEGELWARGSYHAALGRTPISHLAEGSNEVGGEVIRGKVEGKLDGRL